MKIPKPKYINKYKSNYTAKTLEELMQMAQLHKVVLFKYNGDLWRLEKENLDPDK